jgi:outer membrane assembly lipoprotein YfiO
MRHYSWLAFLVILAAFTSNTLAGKWVWTPDTGWQDINKLPRETPRERYNYNAALATDGKYESALAGFEDLLRQYPKGETAEGARYYIGFCRQHLRDYWGAYRAMEDLFQAFPNTKFRDAALRTETTAGREMARMGETRGIDVLKMVARRDAEGELGAEAQMEIGNTYFGQGRYLEARGAYQALITKFPQSPLVETAMFRRGECDVRLVQQQPKSAGVARGAKADLGDYRDQYPKGQWKDQATEYGEIVNRLSKAKDANEVEFYQALLEYNQGRYQETLNRFYRLSWLKGTELGEQAQYYYAECLAHTGQTYAAFKAFEYIFSKYPGTLSARKALPREMALAREMRKTSPGRAPWAYGRVVANDPSGPLAADAQIEMADLYFDQQDWWNAKTAYQGLLTTFPESAWIPKALFRVGMCALEEARIVNVPSTQLAEAQGKFEDYTDRYPDGKYMSDVKAKLDEVQEMKAQVVFETAKWYIGRGQHRAAVIYLNTILRDYARTKSAEEARKVLARLRPETAEKGS